eukprot:8636773-Pyramimonas_sp.AAC.1
MVAASGELQTCFPNAFSRRPCSIDRPWSMAIGLDERAVGDKKRPNNKRTTMVDSVNCLELGGSVLSHEATWMTFAVIRDHIIGK